MIVVEAKKNLFVNKYLKLPFWSLPTVLFCLNSLMPALKSLICNYFNIVLNQVFFPQYFKVFPQCFNFRPKLEILPQRVLVGMEIAAKGRGDSGRAKIFIMQCKKHTRLICGLIVRWNFSPAIPTKLKLVLKISM